MKSETDWDIYIDFRSSLKLQVKRLLENVKDYGVPEMFFAPNDDPRERYTEFQSLYTKTKPRHNDGRIYVLNSSVCFRFQVILIPIVKHKENE